MLPTLIVFGDKAANEVCESAKVAYHGSFDAIVRLYFEEPHFTDVDLPSLGGMDVCFNVGIVDPRIKRAIVERCLRLGWRPFTIVHPSAIVAPSARLGVGAYVGPLAVVSTNAVVGDNTIIQLQSSIGHDSLIGSYCAILPGAKISGTVEVGDRVLIGSNAFVNAGVRIGSDCQVDALTYVVRDLAEGYLLSVRAKAPLKRINLVREDLEIYMNKPIAIIGFGGHGRVIAAALGNKRRIIAITCLSPNQIANAPRNAQVLTDQLLVDKFCPDEVELVLGIGSVKPSGENCFRRRVVDSFQNLGYRFAGLIHPSAWVADDAQISPTAQIHAGAIVQPGTTIGDFTIINTRSSVDHDCRIGNFCHIGPGSTLSGDVSVANGSHLGTGCTVIQGIRIGESCLIAAGAAVVRDVPDQDSVKGIPAKSFRPRS